jgi:hypothetical protein
MLARRLAYIRLHLPGVKSLDKSIFLPTSTMADLPSSPRENELKDYHTPQRKHARALAASGRFTTAEIIETTGVARRSLSNILRASQSRRNRKGVQGRPKALSQLDIDRMMSRVSEDHEGQIFSCEQLADECGVEGTPNAKTIQRTMNTNGYF